MEHFLQEAQEKARFVEFCDAFNIPVLTLTNVLVICSNYVQKEALQRQQQN